MSTLLIKNVKHLVTCDESDNVYSNVNVLAKDGVITYIGKDEKVADDVIDAL